jgi:DNA polymerase-1
VEAFGYRNLSVEGREADDVIGTLSSIADQADVSTCVVSTDRDAFQLVSDRVCLMMTPRGVSDVLVYTPATVAERLGVPHERVPDLIGLKGDTSDDIPGVPGIGEKTAADLLARYGNLEGVYAHIDEITGPKRRQMLVEHKEDAFRSRELGTIVRDLPELADFDPAEVIDAPPDRSRLAELFRRFEMHALLRRIDELEVAMPSLDLSETVVGDAVHAETMSGSEAAAAIAGCDEVGLVADGEELVVALAQDRVLRVAGDDPAALAALAGCGLSAHDFKALPAAVHRAGLTPAFDTVLAAYILEPGRQTYELGDLLRHYAPQLRRGDPADPAVGDALGVLALRVPMTDRLAERGLIGLLADVELPLVPVLASMEEAGVGVDVEHLRAIAERCRAEVAELETEAHRLAGSEFSLGSPKQLGVVLFEQLGLPIERRGKMGPSTDRAVLAKLRSRHPIVPIVERWRELSKLLGTYLDVLPEAVAEDGRIHTTFSQWTAATGRLSCTDPNLQAIPVRTPIGREIRAGFVAAPGFALVSCDYSQVELRILAHLSREEGLIDAFQSGADVHAATAAEVLGIPLAEVDKDQRERAKAVNFGIIYGISAFGLAEQLGIERDEAQVYIDGYLGRYPHVRAFIAQAIADAERDGYARTLLGRQRPLPELQARNHQTRQAGERLAVNSVIQGSAADIIKVAMVACDRRLRDEGRRARLILQIHDELLIETAEEEIDQVRAIAVEEMVGAYPLDPPLVAEAGSGRSWLEAKA